MILCAYEVTPSGASRLQSSLCRHFTPARLTAQERRACNAHCTGASRLQCLLRRCFAPAMLTAQALRTCDTHYVGASRLQCLLRRRFAPAEKRNPPAGYFPRF